MTSANVGPSAEIGSLARRSVSGLHRCVSHGLRIRNSHHHAVTFSVGELVRVNDCHNLHRHGGLPMENRHSGAGTHAHGNPGGAVTGGGGWMKKEWCNCYWGDSYCPPSPQGRGCQAQYYSCPICLRRCCYGRRQCAKWYSFLNVYQ